MFARHFCLFLILFFIAACEITADKPDFDDIRFNAQQPLRLDVARIEIDLRYRAPLSAPNVEHNFPITPEQVLKNWANDRLRASGTQGVATFTIEKASVVETKLKKRTGLTAFFTNQQTERYDGHVKVILHVLRDDSQGRITAEATRSQTAAEHISLNDRDRIYYQLTRDLITALDQEVEAKARLYLSDFLF
jgi:hypothetical protein